MLVYRTSIFQYLNSMKRLIFITIFSVFALNAYCDVRITYYNDGAACQYNAIPYTIGKDGKPVPGMENNRALQHVLIKFEAKKRTMEHSSGEPQAVTVPGNQIHIYGLDTKNGLVLIYDGAEIEINNGLITIKKQGKI